MKDDQAHKISTAEISEWLQQIGKDRPWLADQLSVSIGTVNGWFSESAKRPIPKPTALLIRSLMKSTELGEPTFTFQESLQIQKAMVLADYRAFVDFAHDAVVNETNRILDNARPALVEIKPEDQAEAAEPKTTYRITRKKGTA